MKKIIKKILASIVREIVKEEIKRSFEENPSCNLKGVPRWQDSRV
jgi:hypothetical protein